VVPLVALVTLLAWAGGSPAATSRAVQETPTVLDLSVVHHDGTVSPLRAIVRDGPAVVAFWATYCPPCRAEVPALNRAAEHWRARGLRVLGVALESNERRVRAAQSTWGIRYDVVWLAPGKDDLLERLFPRGLPVTAFVDHGKVTLHDRVLDDEELARRVPALLDGATPVR